MGLFLRVLVTRGETVQPGKAGKQTDFVAAKVLYKAIKMLHDPNSDAADVEAASHSIRRLYLDGFCQNLHVLKIAGLTVEEMQAELDSFDKRII